MSTKPDVIINGSEWYNLRTLANASGVIIIQNKGVNNILVSYNNNPDSSSREGFILTYTQFIKTDLPNIFVKCISGAGTIYVEEVV